MTQATRSRSRSTPQHSCATERLASASGSLATNGDDNNPSDNHPRLNRALPATSPEQGRTTDHSPVVSVTVPPPPPPRNHPKRSPSAPMHHHVVCKLASLTAEVAPVKSPKDHVATRGPSTPKVHHGTQHAVQVVVHPRNTRASSKKELPAALRWSSGHESSADWLTTTEQQDKNVAAAYSCLFYSSSMFLFCSFRFYPLWVLSSVLFSLPSCSLFYSFCSFYWALVLSPSLSYSHCSCCYSLHRSSLCSSSSRRYCLHLRGSSSVPSSGVFFPSTSSPSSVIEFSFVCHRVGGRRTRILELGAVLQSSSLFGQPVVRGATFLH